MKGSVKVTVGEVDDLASLVTLDAALMLEHLQERYRKGVIYTYIGDILVAINPYKETFLYGPEVAQEYTDVQVRSQLAPHLFALSDKAYHAMRRTGANQCCVVSGESGAGKTESTKLLVQHITHLCSYRGVSNLHEKIVQVNPLLEAFGNAQTVLNHNSSRFGKYIELLFANDGSILGARIEEYLLEKSRVVSQGHGERNFHVFYYMFAGLSPDQMKNNLLDRPEVHRILRPFDRPSVFTSESDFKYNQHMMIELQKIMQTVGFLPEDINMIFALLAAILHIADINFLVDTETDGVYIEDERMMEVASELLGVCPEDLAASLISNVTFLRGEKILSLKNVDQANDGRDALCKALYGRLFGWIVQKINIMMHPDRRAQIQSSVGILDIAGFENFTVNSFEQLCINVANEQLQYYFNQHIFQWELDEYSKEGVKGKNIKFTDNRPLIDFFMDRPVGFFCLLDEESKFPKATDVTFLDKVSKQFNKKTYFQRPRGKNDLFSIVHYAGSVVYRVDRFLEKNRDTLSFNLLECMQNSESQIVSDLFLAKLTDTGALMINPNAPKRSRKSMLLCKPPDFSSLKMASISKKAGKQLKAKMSRGSAPGYLQDGQNTARTLSHNFRNSLADLMGKLLDAEPQFVRCLKPNLEKQPYFCNPDLLMQQLKYTGVLETTRIRRLGYPTRLPHPLFIKRYQFIAYPMVAPVQGSAKNCIKILNKAGIKDWEMGKTKVFLRYWHTEELNLCLDQEVVRVIMAQKYVRGFLARKATRRRRDLAEEQRRAMFAFCEHVHDLGAGSFEVMSRHHQEDDDRFSELLHTREAELKNRFNIQGGHMHKKPDKEGIYMATPFAMAIRQNRPMYPRPESPTPAADKTSFPGPSFPVPQLSTSPMSNLPDMPPPPSRLPMFPGGQNGLEPPRHRQQMSEKRSTNFEYKTESMKVSGRSRPEPNETSHYARSQGQYRSITSQLFYEHHLSQTVQKFPNDEDVWGKLFYVEKGEVIAKLYLRLQNIYIDSSMEEFDGSVIGLGAFYNPDRDAKTEKIRGHIGKGVKLHHDKDGNVFACKMTKNDVIVKGYNNPKNCCVSGEVIEAMGRLQQGRMMKIFDIDEYRSHIALELTKPDPDAWRLQCLSITAFSFVRNMLEDMETPCWAFLVNFDALRLLGNENVLQEVASLAGLNLNNPDSIHLRRFWAQLASQFQAPPKETPPTSPRGSFYEGSSIVGPDDSASQIGHRPWDRMVPYPESEAYQESDTQSQAPAPYYNLANGFAMNRPWAKLFTNPKQKS